MLGICEESTARFSDYNNFLFILAYAALWNTSTVRSAWETGVARESASLLLTADEGVPSFLFWGVTPLILLAAR